MLYEGDIERKESIQTWTLGSDIASQQVGNAWGPDGDIVSLSMSGALNIFDQRTGDVPARVLKVGHTSRMAAEEQRKY